MFALRYIRGNMNSSKQLWTIMNGKTTHIKNPSPAFLSYMEKLMKIQEENKAKLQAKAEKYFAASKSE